MATNGYKIVLLVLIIVSACFFYNPHADSAVAINKTTQTSGTFTSDSPILNNITFSGYNWTVRAQANSYPGPNNWSSSNQNVWLDDNGWLHLKITNRDGVWYSSEIYCSQPLGYGTYTFHTKSAIDNLDKNAVLGLFIYKDNDHEIDIEYSRWGDKNFYNTGFTVQPAPHYEYVSTLSFETTLNQTEATHLFVWNTTSVLFETIQGNYTLTTAPQQSIIKQWTSSRSCASTGEIAIINLWLYKGQPPSDGQPVEVIVTGFEFTPITPPSDPVPSVMPSSTPNPTLPVTPTPNPTVTQGPTSTPIETPISIPTNPTYSPTETPIIVPEFTSNSSVLALLVMFVFFFSASLIIIARRAQTSRAI